MILIPIHIIVRYGDKYDNEYDDHIVGEDND